MKNKLIGIFLFSLLVLPSNGFAEISGDQILKACKADIKNTQEGAGKVFCLGYLSGYLDSYMITSEVHGGNKKLFCLPSNGIGSNEAAQIVVNYLQKNPSKLQQSARSLIILSFIEKFPCK